MEDTGLIARALCGAAGDLTGTVALTALRRGLRSAGIVEITAPDQVVARLEDFIGEFEPAPRRVLVLVAHYAYGMTSGAAFGAVMRRPAADYGTEAAAGAAMGVLA